MKIENYKLKIHKEAPLLLYGATEPEHPNFSPDMLWRTGFRVPDPFWMIEKNGEIWILVSRLEYGRAKKEAKVDKVFLHEGSITDFLKTQKITSVKVPASFPVGIAEHLKQYVRLEVMKGDSFPERAIKTAWEVKEIEKAGRAVGKAIDEARAVLKKSLIKGEKVYFKNKVLTSEFLRGIIESSLFEAGYLASGTIVSSGKDSAYPHAVGNGPIRAHMPIVMDIFPRSKATNYYADITRTVFKGEPSAPIKQMYQTVLDAQEQAIKNVRAGIDASGLHRGVVKLFDECGYKTTVNENQTEGFIHGLGHGVGIEIHEAPRVGGVSHILKAGNVITIEPGLYYPTKGFGIRIEDMLLVTESRLRGAMVSQASSTLLSPIPKNLKWALIL